MSWLTPVIREIQADRAATQHKLKFFENAATPNLAVSLAKEVTADQFGEFVEQMDRSHNGTENAYKTLYTAGGADVTVIGADFKQLDFKATQGAGETRIAAAAGVGAILANLSEGMQGSSLNAGNYGAAKRRFADGTMRPLWRNAAASLAVLLKPPPGGGQVRLTYDDRDIAFLREDQRDVAEIQAKEAQTIRTLTMPAGPPESIKAAIQNDGDWSLLVHSGLFSVQLQPPGTDEHPTGRTRGHPNRPGRAVMETLRDLDLVRALPPQAHPTTIRATATADDAATEGPELGRLVVRFSPFNTWYASPPCGRATSWSAPSAVPSRRRWPSRAPT
jgi:hypothetical protein